MGNPAPFQARSRLRGTPGLRRSGAISVSQCHSLHHYPLNHNHANCPCCSSTLTHLHDPTARYAPYALSARRAFHRRRRHRHPAHALDLVSHANVDMDDLDMDHGQDALSDSESGSESGSDSLSNTEAHSLDDDDAIPFPYSSSNTTNTNTPSPFISSTPTSFSFNNPLFSPPPIPRLPSSDEIQRLYGSLPTDTDVSANASAALERRMSRLRSNMRASSTMFPAMANSMDTSDSDPEPWMYGTLPRRSAVTTPVSPLRSSADTPRDRDQSAQLVSPSSGITVASSSTSSTNEASPSSSTPQEHQQGGSLVGTVIRNVYSSITSLLGGSSTIASATEPTTRTTIPRHDFLSGNPYLTALHPTHTLPSEPTTSAAAPQAPDASLADLASTSVSSTRPISRPRSQTPRRPTGLALAPALSARSRGTLANAAAQAQAQARADRHGPWFVPGESTFRSHTNVPPAANAPTGFGQSNYMHALSSYPHFSSQGQGQGAGGGGGGRGGRLVFPPTPRSFYATVGPSSPARALVSGTRESSSRVLFDLEPMGGRGSSDDASPFPMTRSQGPVNAAWSQDQDNASTSDAGTQAHAQQARLRDVRQRHMGVPEHTDGLLRARPASNLEWALEEEGQRAAGSPNPGARMHREEEELVGDDLNTYIPAYLLRNAGAVDHGRGSSDTEDGAELEHGIDEDEEQEEELGPMDDSWEMVVRPFDSLRRPETTYNYHEHMF